MERSEPTLVPQWLRSTGNISGGGSSTHHLASSSSSSSTSDLSSSAQHTENRSSKSFSNFESPHLVLLDHTSSSNSRRNSSNSSARHAYSSFNRSHRDRDRERDKARSSGMNHWDLDSSDPLGSILGGPRGEKDILRRSHSIVSRKHGELFTRRAASDVKSGSSNNHVNGNGLISMGSIGSSGQRAVFEKDFPSLGSEEKQGVHDGGRVASPSLSSVVQSLPTGSSALIGGEGWISALAEVPHLTGMGCAVQSIAAPVAASAVAGLNMAEALTQAPPNSRTPPLLSVQTQRMEELVIKQSRQLIPVTPSTPKSSITNLSDKTKSKVSVRSGEVNLPAKSMQQNSSSLHPGGQSLVAGNVKSDGLKTSQGKLYVLKPGRENGILTSPKDVSSPTTTPMRAPNSQLSVSSVLQSAPPRSPTVVKLPTGDRKQANLNLTPAFSLEKRPSLSQTQSRNDFFNLLKKKTSMNNSTDTGSVVSSPTSEISCEVNKDVVNDPDTVPNGAELTSNGGDFIEAEISEEEAAFLRSLGWEENSGEDEGLTEEEIKGFYQECVKLRPSLKVCKGMQQKLLESQATILGGASSELSPSDAGSEA